MVQKHDSIILLVDKVLYPLGPLNAIYKKPTNAVICQGTSSGLAGFGWKFIHTLQPSEKVCASDCYMASQTYMTRTFFLTENLGWSKMSQLPLGTRGSSYGFCIGCVMLHRSACLRILPFFFFSLWLRWLRTFASAHTWAVREEIDHTKAQNESNILQHCFPKCF